MVVPMLSPNRMGRAPASPSTLWMPSGPACCAARCSTAMVAELLCTTSVIPVPSSSPSSGVCRTCVIQRRKTGCSASGAIAPDKTSMPSNSRPNENTASPSCRVRSRRASSQTSTPTNRMGNTQSASRNATSWAVTVVPTLAPNTTATACGSSISPALTNPMTITVVAELLCNTAVTRSPASAPVSGVRVMRRRNPRIRSPAACCNARLILSIPNKNSASPPASPNAARTPSPMCRPPLGVDNTKILAFRWESEYILQGSRSFVRPDAAHTAPARPWCR